MRKWSKEAIGLEIRRMYDSGENLNYAHIAQEQVDGPRKLGFKSNRLLQVACCDDCESGIFQNLPDELAKDRVVFNKQNGLERSVDW